MGNHKMKYHLMKWWYYDFNFGGLKTYEKVKMKILYSALKEMTPEERQFLAEKYRVAKRPYIKDSIMAERLGIDSKDYSKKRIQIESKLQSFIAKFDEKFEGEFQEELEKDNQENGKPRKPEKIMSFTQLKDDADRAYEELTQAFSQNELGDKPDIAKIAREVMRTL